ncbi:flagellum-specific ATP synthase [Ameyamaea chiangmaiensis NBRC 103196]|uniref:Flagellar protein export ATPase FliI n=1 Tax=Ameyamaea chiangmaiensis TaxID=442969 RepID=A0A850P657_9PROT|nr:FliI/YscN family ATPase [Ameyamaea chiangmaiensis]MBS4076025.1 flagellar protein export ATPase FliI [Ameyamaea chiangmaiensis]NVN40107.1 flagellar protein export ATPase FliI [Ameyamaea chiangmaiensis]GBQ61418.1 flagellum-specific ATP synthase [Ameyamaea chiangmaiensis NBRC 103196]
MKPGNAMTFFSTPAAAEIHGKVYDVSGLYVSVSGFDGLLSVGDRLDLHPLAGGSIRAEVVGFCGSLAKTMVFGDTDGLGPGSKASLPLYLGQNAMLRRGGLPVSDRWLGRVVDPLGAPLDGGPRPGGSCVQPTRAAPLNAMERARLGPRLDLGVRVLNAFTTCCEGQRLGLFAGSGVGKSTLLAMLARFTSCDVAVVALVGERGREVREFLEDELGEDARQRTAVVVATSDCAPLMRREAAYTAMTIAEHFRDQGLSVLLLMDSVTRFCLALREIGLSMGEPPATRGYPPSVFAELPRLLERAGPGRRCENGKEGHITALFTVLVEGDDQNEPVADAVRGILDGHIILDRAIAEAGRYPAVDVLRSLSRTSHRCTLPAEKALVSRARALMASYAEMADMIRLGAYKAGSDPEVDEAIRVRPAVEAILRQEREERASIEDSFAALQRALA